MVLGKKVAIFDWEWGRNSAPRELRRAENPLHIFPHVVDTFKNCDLL